MASIRKSLALSLAEKYSGILIGIAGTVILARLLSPAQIGIYSVAAAFVGLAHIVRDFGVGGYLVQERELTTDRIRTAVSVTTVTAWSIAVVLAALSGPIAALYGEPLLQQVVLVLCLNFVLLPLNSPAISLLRRDMKFGALFKINLAANLARFTTGVGLAWQGVGVMSLAWASVAGVVVTLLMTLFFRPDWRLWLPSFKEVRRVASFGFKASAAGIVAELGTSATDLIIGRMLGFAPVGLFSRAQGVMFLFHRQIMGAVRGVAFPAMAVKTRAGDDLRAFYLRGMTYVTGLAWPFYALLALMAFPVVRIMFGDQWDAAIPLVRILALAGVIGTLFSFSSSLMMARGNVGAILRLEIVIQISRVILLLLASLYSLEAVAWSVCGTYLVAAVANNWMLHRLIALSMRDLFRALVPSAVVTGFSVIAPVLTVLFLDVEGEDMFLSLALASAGAGLGWLLAIHVTNHPIKGELQDLWARLVPAVRTLRLGAGK